MLKRTADSFGPLLGRVRVLARATVPAVASLAVASCTLVPKDGPTGFEVQNNAEVKLEDPGRLSYVSVKLSPLTVTGLQTEPQPPVLFSRLSRQTSRAEGRLAPSDIVSVSIFESGAGGLFVPSDAGARPGNYVQIPPQEIDRSGNITIPYGGQIKAVGRTTGEIAADIVQHLEKRAIEPQAIVTVGERGTDGVTLLGDVRSPGVLPVRPGGIRLLQAMARVGGPAGPPFSTVVTLRRGRESETALLTSIIEDRRQDIELMPGDVINVSNVPRIFLAFGAVGTGGSSINIGLGAAGSSQPGRRFPIDRANMTLAEALAAAGGVAGGSADARSVFLFRYVPKATLARAGVDVSAFPGPRVPTVLTLDVGQAEGYFLANEFYVKHNDILYVSEAPFVDLQKILAIPNLLTSFALQYRF